MIHLPETLYVELKESGTSGICTCCDSVLLEGVEGDARRLPCPNCGAKGLWSLEELLNLDMIRLIPTRTKDQQRKLEYERKMKNAKY